jgi:hypothetical protein
MILVSSFDRLISSFDQGFHEVVVKTSHGMYLRTEKTNT